MVAVLGIGTVTGSSFRRGERLRSDPVSFACWAIWNAAGRAYGTRSRQWRRAGTLRVLPRLRHYRNKERSAASGDGRARHLL